MTRVEGMRVIFVQQSETPYYGYTIGLRRSCGVELMFAGGLCYYVFDIHGILEDVAAILSESGDVRPRTVDLGRDLGVFELRPALAEWITALYPVEDDPATPCEWLQVTPTGEGLTLDVADLSRPRPLDERDAWQWLDREWDLPAPPDAHLVVTLAVLRGARPITVYRWELDQWEALEAPAHELAREDGRVAPIGLIRNVVTPWEDALKLEPGEGFALED